MGVFRRGRRVRQPVPWHKKLLNVSKVSLNIFLCLIIVLQKHLLVRHTLHNASPYKRRFTIAVNSVIQIHDYTFGRHKQISAGPALQTSTWIRQCSSLTQEALCKQSSRKYYKNSTIIPQTTNPLKTALFDHR